MKNKIIKNNKRLFNLIYSDSTLWMLALLYFTCLNFTLYIIALEPYVYYRNSFQNFLPLLCSILLRLSLIILQTKTMTIAIQAFKQLFNKDKDMAAQIFMQFILVLTPHSSHIISAYCRHLYIRGWGTIPMWFFSLGLCYFSVLHVSMVIKNKAHESNIPGFKLKISPLFIVYSWVNCFWALLSLHAMRIMIYLV